MMRILLTEDDDSVRSFVSRALELDDSCSARLGGHRLTYSTELGLLDERAT